MQLMGGVVVSIIFILSRRVGYVDIHTTAT